MHVYKAINVLINDWVTVHFANIRNIYVQDNIKMYMNCFPLKQTLDRHYFAPINNSINIPPKKKKTTHTVNH